MTALLEYLIKEIMNKNSRLCGSAVTVSLNPGVK